MPLRTKLFLAFGSLAVLAAFIALLSITTNRRIERDIGRVRRISIEEARIAERMREALHDLEIGFLRDEKETKSQRLQRGSMLLQNLLSDIRKAQEQSWARAEEENAPQDIAEAKLALARLENIRRNFQAFQESALGTSADPKSVQLLYECLHSSVEEHVGASMQGLENKVQAVDSSLHAANRILCFSSLGLFFVGAGMAWMISRSLARPLGLLTHAAREISHGRLDTRIDFHAQDEIGLLADTFNRMAQDLQSTTVSKDYLDRILASMANALLVLDPDKRVRSSNAAALRLLHYSEAELAGLPMDRILEEPDPDGPPVLERVPQTGALTEMELFFRTRSGERVPVSFSASALTGEQGETTGLVCVAQDISARKKAEEALEETGKKLLETSRQAGMAEVAANILHNVGNVLNSVNVSSSIIADRISGTKATNLGKAAALLQEHAHDLPEFLRNDAKGKMLPGYLADLAETLAHEKEDLLEEVESLVGKVKHIKEIVGMQQSYARVSGLPEECRIEDLMETAVRINADSLVRHQVRLVRDYEDLPPVLVQKHKVLQILVNLLSNAKYACDESGSPDKQVILRIANGDNRCKISVIDNGIGIPAENLTRIFSHGFTTKKDGHGFGLHSGALAAQEMGGRLTVLSDGPGRGSTFTLDLPLHPPEESP
jgi:PAS domain S-box-containing protein